MAQVKVFANTNENWLAGEVNRWLQENEDIVVRHMAQSVRTLRGEFGEEQEIILTLLYERLPKREALLAVESVGVSKEDVEKVLRLTGVE